MPRVPNAVVDLNAVIPEILKQIQVMSISGHLNRVSLPHSAGIH
jgi:hypothetical protein